MFKMFGIGARFVFDPTDSKRQMTQLAKSFGRMSKRVGQLKKALGPYIKIAKIAAVIGGVALAAGMTKAISTAAAFEHQMSAVAAVSGATEQQMSQLEAQAKMLGATTSFTAQQAGQAQELLARAGFKVNEIIGAMPGVLAAAAAEGMDLATSADIIASAIRGFGMEASEAGHVADVLAKAAASSNTNMIELGEGLRYSTAQMRTMGFSLEDTVAALGKISDAGIKASMAGTSLAQAFVKLAKPSDKGAAIMEKWGVQLTDAQGKMKPMGDIIAQFGKQLDKIKDPVKRAATMTELFGIRGQKAMVALMSAGGEALNNFTQTLVESTGAAQAMASKRLDNLKGAFTLFRSAMEGFFIETGQRFLRPLTKGLQRVTKFMSDVVIAMQGGSTTVNEAGKQVSLLGTTAWRVAQTITQGIDTVMGWVEAFQAMWPTMKAVIGPSLERLMASLSALFGTVEEGSIQGETVFGALTATIATGIEVLNGVVVAIGVVVGSIKTMIEYVKTAYNWWGDLLRRINESKIAKLALGLVPGGQIVRAAAGIAGGSPESTAPSPAPPPRAPATAGVREMGVAARARGGRGGPVRVELGGAGSSTQKIVVENKLYLDGREIRHNLASQEVQLADRSGRKLTPGQRREALEQGKLSAVAAGAGA